MIKQITIKNYRSIKEISFNLVNYSLLVGANNSGKSNILNAVNLFLDSKGKPTKDDFCNLVQSSKINISMAINDTIISKEWEIKDGKVNITAKLDKEHQEILDQFVPIYIPTIEKVEDTTKVTGTNVFGKILHTISESFSNYKKYQEINKLIQEINKDQDSPIKEIEQKLQSSLDTSFTSYLTPNISTDLNAQDLFKSINIYFQDDKNNKIAPGSIGSGMQRALIYNLIMLLNKLNDQKKYILLYDEPEVCLHPSQQRSLAFHLKKELSNTMQILVSSHSSIFAVSNTKNINSIIRVEYYKENGSKVYQVDTLDNIKDIYKSTFSNTTEYLDIYRYINWFNQERGQLFFAKGVLLVEGLTEKGLFEFLSDQNSEWSFLQKNHIYILDCTGKHEIIRWAEVVKKLNIPFGIIFDKDNDKTNHEDMNTKIKELYGSNIIESFSKDLEEYLGVTKCKHHEHTILLYVDKDIQLESLPTEISTDITEKKDKIELKLNNLREKIYNFFLEKRIITTDKTIK